MTRVRRIVGGVIVAAWSVAWVAFWVSAFLLFAIASGFTRPERVPRRRDIANFAERLKRDLAVFAAMTSPTFTRSEKE